MVIIRLTGGIGNQLFMYFAAYRLAKRLKVNIIVDDITGFAKDKKYETIFLGPFKSNKYPKGIWTLANPKKYPPPKRPNSPADKSNSFTNSGEIVAVIALSKVEIK